VPSSPPSHVPCLELTIPRCRVVARREPFWVFHQTHAVHPHPHTHTSSLAHTHTRRTGSGRATPYPARSLIGGTGLPARREIEGSTDLRAQVAVQGEGKRGEWTNRAKTSPNSQVGLPNCETARLAPHLSNRPRTPSQPASCKPSHSNNGQSRVLNLLGQLSRPNFLSAR
jgi:hypothetical protein